ncbi:YceI family protein [Spiribacter sp. 1M153]|uniref:YceI family protein n=1 Tax=Spiribacter roseus TaxID=1855875 RepID=UPI00349F4695
MLRLTALVLLLAGCSTAPLPTQPAVSASPAASEEGLPSLPDGRRYIVDPAASHLRIILGAEGPLAALGHPHVIGGPVVDGTVVVADRWQDSAFRLEVPVAELTVDRAAWRAVEGLEPDVPESAIRATRQNMLGESQLDAASHPLIRLSSLAITGPEWQPDVRFRVTIAGETSVHTVPISLDRDDSELTATGALRTRFSELSLVPYSALGGGLRVADELRIRFQVKAFTDESP